MKDWLADHVEVPADLTAEQLAADLVKVGLEEEAIHGAAVTGPLVVGRVLEMTPEPQKNGKTINWCRVDVGPEHNDADGAARHRLRRAQLRAPATSWSSPCPAPCCPGRSPIAARKTYGHVSDGMICSVNELGIGEDHDGILVLTRNGFAEADLTPGQDADRAPRPRRGDPRDQRDPGPRVRFSYRGVAREYAHSTGAEFTDHGLATGSETCRDPGRVRGPGARRRADQRRGRLRPVRDAHRARHRPGRADARVDEAPPRRGRHAVRSPWRSTSRTT